MALASSEAYKYPFQYEYEKSHNENVETFVKGLETYFDFDYGSLNLFEMPKIIKTSVDMIKSAKELDGEGKLMVLKDTLKVIISKTNAAGSFESTAVILTPKIIDAFLEIDEDGNIRFVDRDPPGRKTQKCLVCLQGCAVKGDKNQQIEEAKEERKETEKNEKEEWRNLGERHKTEWRNLGERHKTEWRDLGERQKTENKTAKDSWMYYDPNRINESKKQRGQRHKSEKETMKHRHNDEKNSMKHRHNDEKNSMKQRHNNRKNEEKDKRNEIKERYKKEKKELEQKQNQDYSNLKNLHAEALKKVTGEERKALEKEQYEEMTRLIISNKVEKQNFESMFQILLA